MNIFKDTKRLNWIIEHLADIDAPEEGESSTWVIYTKSKALHKGAGCHRNLRKAIDIAMSKPPLP
jgi:hypothetical protein